MGDVDHAAVGSHLRLLFEAGTVIGVSDRHLLEMFVSRRDELAFTALLERHGPMVQRVCHEVLGDHHDAQDAFQATFFVLAQSAGSIRQRDSLASWLYGVALRVAAGARSASARRLEHERNWATLRAVETESCTDSREDSGALLHEEIGRLPERFRTPVVLCYLEGRTYEEAAQVLHCPVGTIKSRLSTARERLRRRLEHRNLATSSGSVGSALQGGLPMTTVPTPLPVPVLQAVSRNATGGLAPATISHLAQGVLKTMRWHRLIYRLGVAGAILIGTAAVATGAVGLTGMNHNSPADGEHEVAVTPPSLAQPPPKPLEDRVSGPKSPPRRGQPITLAGRIVDERGGAVPGALVRARLIRTSVQPNVRQFVLPSREDRVRAFRSMRQGIRQASKEVEVWEATTDVQGHYRIEGFRGIEGNDNQHLAIDVNAPDFVEFADFYFEFLDRVAKAKGALADVRLERGAAVMGRCVGPDGKAVPGAKIHAAFADKPLSSLGRTRTTDAEGRFRLVIPHGRAAELIVYPEQWAPRRVSVAAGGGDLGDVRLEAGAELSGQLVMPTASVSREQVQDFSAHQRIPGGWALAGKVIALECTEPGLFDWFPITLACKTDRDGRFRIPALQGSFKIWVAQAHDSGPDDHGPIASDGPPPAVLPQVVDFNTGSGGVAGRFFRRPSRKELALVANRPVTIRGTITGPDGKRAQGVSLDLSVAIGSLEENFLTPLQWTTTDADGHYTFTGIPRGLTRAYLTVYTEPPKDHSSVAIVASGRFQGRRKIRPCASSP